MGEHIVGISNSDEPPQETLVDTETKVPTIERYITTNPSLAGIEVMFTGGMGNLTIDGQEYTKEMLLHLIASGDKDVFKKLFSLLGTLDNSSQLRALNQKRRETKYLIGTNSLFDVSERYRFNETFEVGLPLSVGSRNGMIHPQFNFQLFNSIPNPKNGRPRPAQFPQYWNQDVFLQRDYQEAFEYSPDPNNHGGVVRLKPEVVAIYQDLYPPRRTNAA